MKVFITDKNLISPLGFSVEENWDALVKGKSGLQKQSRFGLEFYSGIINDEKIDDSFKNISQKSFSRFEKLLILALKPLIEKHQPGEKSLLILSTTKGNISALKNKNETPEESFLAKTAQNMADFFGFKMPAIVVSNACVSGVMAVSTAKKLIKNGYCEDAFVIAADEVTDFVLSGFSAFQAMSSEICRPYDRNRDGISIGEAAAAVYISKNPGNNAFEILGEASINDANHISGPSRTGEGLFRSISSAMREAEVTSEEIDCISGHGTATVYNDEMESFAFSRAGLSQVPLNSLKGFYGHCLGAAGLVEIIMAIESATHNLLIKTMNYEENGVSQPVSVLKENLAVPVTTILKTASGFGGSNSAIIIRKSNEED